MRKCTRINNIQLSGSNLTDLLMQSFSLHSHPKQHEIILNSDLFYLQLGVLNY